MSNVKQKNHELPLREKWINMSAKEIKHLFIYYMIVLLVSFAWVGLALLYQYEFSEAGFKYFVGIFMFACPSGILGATVYYIRKLYKSCIQNLVYDDNNDKDVKIRKIGAKAYFYCRPIISGIIAVLINIGIIAGLFGNISELKSDNYFLFIILVSSYVGFHNGKVILRVESQSEPVESLLQERGSL